jgi:Zn-dependent M28 family amino/carboxypeptidase
MGVVTTGMRAGLLAGVLALGNASRPAGAAAQGIQSADTASLMATVRVLAADSMEGRKAGTPGSVRAQAYLERRLAALGIAPLVSGYRQRFALPRDAGTGVNLLGVIRGRRFPGRYVVLTAHYDHVGIRGGQIYNGADDNASGTAAVLALAEIFQGTPPEQSVIVALLDAEEIGSPGARAFLEAGLVPRDSIVLNLNLDMVGHSEPGVLWAAGAAHTPGLRPVLDSVARIAPVTLKLGHDRSGIPGEEDWTGSSDHRVFQKAGIPFIYFGVEDHRDYHRPTDDADTLTPAFFGKAVGTILTATRKLDSLTSSGGRRWR